MSNTTCSNCALQVPAGAAACPNCRTPITAAKPKKINKGCLGASGGCLALIALVLIIVACTATASKPTESELRSEVCTKLGTLVCGGGALAESLGFVTLKYHDYIFFSTLTVQTGQDKEETIAYGMFGQVLTGDARNKNAPKR